MLISIEKDEYLSTYAAIRSWKRAQDYQIANVENWFASNPGAISLAEQQFIKTGGDVVPLVFEQISATPAARKVRANVEVQDLPPSATPGPERFEINLLLQPYPSRDHCQCHYYCGRSSPTARAHVGPTFCNKRSRAFGGDHGIHRHFYSHGRSYDSSKAIRSVGRYCCVSTKPKLPRFTLTSFGSQLMIFVFVNLQVFCSSNGILASRKSRRKQS